MSNRRRFRLFAVCVLAVATAAGSRFASIALAADSVPLDQVQLRGRVVDESGAGVGGIEVRIATHSEVPAVQTTDEGHFTLLVPKSRARYLNLLATNAERTRQGYLYSASVPSGGDAVDITLKPAAETEIAVKDGAGLPIAGARVVMMSWSTPLDERLTDEAGIVKMRFPAEAPAVSVLSLKSGFGMDYWTVGPVREPQPVPPKLTLTLDGALTLKVQLTTEEGRPAPGLEVTPWLIHRERHPHDLNLSGVRVHAATGPDGVATFDWFPLDAKGGIPILLQSNDYSLQDRINWLCDSPAREVRGVVLKRPTFSGRVVLHGKPAAGVTVQLEGHGPTHDYCRTFAVTDANGDYSARVDSRNSYIIAVTGADFAGNLVDIAAYPGEDRSDLNIELSRGTLLQGRVTKPDGTSASDTVVTLIQYGSLTPFAAAETESSRGNRGSLVAWPKTNAEGEYAVRVGPGEYELRPAGALAAKFNVVDEESMVHDFQISEARASPQPLTVTVVDAAGQPVSGALVTGVAEGRFINGKTTGNGTCVVRRLPQPVQLFVEAPRGDAVLKGLINVGANEASATVVVQPTGSGFGRVVDEEGNPIPALAISYDMKLGEHGNMVVPSLGGMAVTDDEGRFEFENLMAGQRYAGMHRIGGHSVSVTGEFTVRPGERVEFGNRTLPREKRLRTSVERLRHAFRSGATPVERFEQTIAVADRQGQKLLLLVAPPEHAAVRSLFAQLYPPQGRGAFTKSGISEPRLLDYEIVAFTPEELQRDRDRLPPALKRIGELDSAAIAIATSEGEVEAVIEESEWTDAGAASIPKLLANLQQQAPSPRDAEALLRNAFSAAAKEGRQVLMLQLELDEPNSQRLAEAVAENWPELEPFFELVALDLRRDRNAADVAALFQGEGERHAPWMGVINPEGDLIAVRRPKNSYVSWGEVRESFLSLLRDSGTPFSDPEWERIAESLQREPSW